MVIGREIHQVSFVQGVEPLPALFPFQLPECEQRAIRGVAMIEGTDLGELQEIGP